MTEYPLGVLDFLVLTGPAEIQQRRNCGFLGVLPDTIDGRGDASERMGRSVFGEGNGIEGDLLKGVITRPWDRMRGRREMLDALTSRAIVFLSDEWLARKRREPCHVLIPCGSACGGHVAVMWRIRRWKEGRGYVHENALLGGSWAEVDCGHHTTGLEFRGACSNIGIAHNVAIVTIGITE